MAVFTSLTGGSWLFASGEPLAELPPVGTMLMTLCGIDFAVKEPGRHQAAHRRVKADAGKSLSGQFGLQTQGQVAACSRAPNGVSGFAGQAGTQAPDHTPAPGKTTEAGPEPYPHPPCRICDASVTRSATPSRIPD
jgi:hypothetical protein